MNKHQLKKQIDRERYIRWQNYRITQLSFSINLFLTFGVASIGFWTKLIMDDNFIIHGTEKSHFYYAFYWLSSSIGSGVFATITRLIDFRYTAFKIRKKYKGSKSKLVNFIAKYVGHLTWIFFGVQTGSLTIGIFFLLESILAVHMDKFI